MYERSRNVLYASDFPHSDILPRLSSAVRLFLDTLIWGRWTQQRSNMEHPGKAQHVTLKRQGEKKERERERVKELSEREKRETWLGTSLYWLPTLSLSEPLHCSDYRDALIKQAASQIIHHAYTITLYPHLLGTTHTAPNVDLPFIWRSPDVFSALCVTRRIGFHSGLQSTAGSLFWGA